MRLIVRRLTAATAAAAASLAVAGAAHGAPAPPACTEVGGGILGGTTGNDVLCGRDESDDRLYAYGGNDVLIGRTGADRMGGGIGNDYYYVDDPADKVVEQAGHGFDTVRLQTSAQYTVPTFVQRVRAWGSAIDVLGTAFGDEIIGEGADDRIDGLQGADVLDGGDGDDTVYGDTPEDDPTGGGNDTLVGGGGDDFLDGRFGRDTLSGGEGDDRLDGSFGDDTLTGGAGADNFYFGPPPDDDTITDFVSGTDEISLYGAAPGATYVGSGALPGGGEKAVQVVAGSTSTKVNVDLDGNGTISPATYGDFVITMPAGTVVAESDLVLVSPPD